MGDLYVSGKSATGVLGVHANTLRKLADKGSIDFYRTDGGQRRYNVDSYLKHLGSKPGAGKNFLTEASLGRILKAKAPDLEFIHNKAVPGSVNKRWRPDYRCESKKLIIEFNGDTHYRSSRVIDRDYQKSQDYTRLGYVVVCVPYFIQLDSALLSALLDRDIDYEQTYPHGFISDKCILPADFCELGVSRFSEDMSIYELHVRDVASSLYDKVSVIGDVRMVLPSTIKVSKITQPDEHDADLYRMMIAESDYDTGV